MEFNIFLALGTVIFVVIVGLPDLLQNPTTYLDLRSFVVVLFGSFAALLISSKFAHFKIFMKAGRLILLPQKQMTAQEAITQLVAFSKIAKSKGKIGLVTELDGIKDPFMKFGVQLLTEKLDHGFIRATLYNDIEEMQNRHDNISGMYKNMSQFSPVFGMIGTIIGLIQVLKNLDDPTKIGPAMALALVTTLYGAIFSGLVFTPMGQKLSIMTEDEVYLKKIITEGILMIEKEEIPLKVEKYLMSFLHDQAKQKEKNK